MAFNGFWSSQSVFVNYVLVSQLVEHGDNNTKVNITVA